MNVITLTSDLGTKDYYLAALKAAAFRSISNIHWVDISHHIAPFDMAKAAFVLKNVWREFPEGAIHIISVDSDWRAETPYAVVVVNGQYFIGSDNGFFSILLDDQPADNVYHVKMQGDEDLSFPTKTILVPLAARIAGGESLEEIGASQDDYKHRPTINPVIEHENIRGTVIYVDSYGNVITNITRSLFEDEVKNQPFRIVLRKSSSEITSISRAYNEVPQGEIVALFTSAGYLEIAINRGVEGSGGGATDLLGLRENDVVRIEIGE
ncbi:MAG: S-adenosyl-l-methionine hydroxide adenosyltransferase family protein [Cryomorphaceae bacterium]